MITWMLYLFVAMLALLGYLVSQIGHNHALWIIGFWVVTAAGTIFLLTRRKSE